MGANMPKQYLPLRGQPIALYSLQTFAAMPEVGEVVVVCDPSYRDIFQGAQLARKVPMKFALPGASAACRHLPTRVHRRSVGCALLRLHRTLSTRPLQARSARTACSTGCKRSTPPPRSSQCTTRRARW